MSRPWSWQACKVRTASLLPCYLNVKHVQALVLAGLQGKNCLWPGYLDMKHVQALVLAGLQDISHLSPDPEQKISLIVKISLQGKKICCCGEYR